MSGRVGEKREVVVVRAVANSFAENSPKLAKLPIAGLAPLDYPYLPERGESERQALAPSIQQHSLKKMNRRIVKCAIILAGTLVFTTLTYTNHLHLHIPDRTPLYPSVWNAEYSSSTTPEPLPTLVHYDPYFLDGFRNQHMRFVAFVAYAVERNISQILLPSLRWMNHYNKPNSIHHELLFDVRYWNSRAAESGLPRLVDYDPSVLEGTCEVESENRRTNDSPESAGMIPCFNISSSLYSGLDEAVLRHPEINIRQTKTWELIGKGGENDMYAHCRFGLKDAAVDYNCSSRVYERFTLLIPHGGMGAGGAGRLWWEYMSMQNRRGGAKEIMTINNQTVSIYPEHVHVEKAVYELLRPSKQLNFALDDGLSKAMHNAATKCANGHDCEMVGDDPTPRILALHPRVEREMLEHQCSKLNENNLTKVFERIQNYPAFLDAQNNSDQNSTNYRFNMVFIAVSKSQILQQTENVGGGIRVIMNENRNMFLRARKFGLLGGIPVFESGVHSASTVKFPRSARTLWNHGDFEDGAPSLFDSPETLGVLELVASIIDFFTAVRAEIFVGVKGSSFSTDVFSIRYYQHKSVGGLESYISGPDGIQRLYGPPHSLSC